MSTKAPTAGRIRSPGTGGLPACLARPVLAAWTRSLRTPFRLLLFRWARDLYCIGDHEGIRICDFTGDPEQHDVFLARTVAALDLLKEADTRRFRRVQRCVACIGHVRPAQLNDRVGAYDPILRLCYLCPLSYIDDAMDDGDAEPEPDTDPANVGPHAAPGHREYLESWRAYQARLSSYEAGTGEDEARTKECEALAREHEALVKQYEALLRAYEAREALAPVIDYAATLAHEATHGAVDEQYNPRTCLRIERLCLLEERRLVQRHWPWAIDWLPQEVDEEYYLGQWRRRFLGLLPLGK